MSSNPKAGKHPLLVESEGEEDRGVLESPSETELLRMGYDSSSDEAENNESAPIPMERQRDAALARMQRLFGLDMDELPSEPIVQDDSHYLRKMYWTCIQDSGFPHRVNHAVAALK